MTPGRALSMTTDELATTVRAASEADAPRLAELLTQLGYLATAQAVRERFAYWMPGEMSRILVAEYQGNVVGSIALHAIRDSEQTGRWLHIESLVVDQRARLRGAGRALVGAAEDVAREWGCARVAATSLQSRPGAPDFYHRLGFTSSCASSGRFMKDLA
jgi:N-acetylglutamate synthase-like GNAT family acetyltransferase